MKIYYIEFTQFNLRVYLCIQNIFQKQYLVSVIDTQSNVLIYLSLYTNTLINQVSPAYYIYILYEAYTFNLTSRISLGVFSLNIKGISLYLWYNYQIFSQRPIYHSQASNSNLSLVSMKVKSKNLFKRYAVFRF